ncbi:DDE family endonuclease [Rhizoctonia solani AG-3 Rhs1AP]|uniref:DDE family endonuclease n=1 Tax=Rhizoctonia solani AG-3 Rhs1AP TaxID=1086054 RepID=X8IXU9_9AGAM|nr:DDE family endonuclease [Rhizoctonia solani AG-3 Rhs1AP]
MNPFPGPNSVIVMDNCRIHKNAGVLNMITESGCKYEFLPPYSPDLNPVEPAFAKFKQLLKRSGEVASEAMSDEEENFSLHCHIKKSQNRLWSIYMAAPQTIYAILMQPHLNELYKSATSR